MFSDMLEDKELGWEGWKALKSNTPYANLFYTEWAFNHFIDWQVRESLNPGSLQRLENWYKYERDQEFIDIGLPFVSPWGDPSEFVREGGPRHMGDVISTLVR
jgi:hypothetical protein